jgi:molybdate-binding protein
LLALLNRAGAELPQLQKAPVCPTGPDLAQAIRGGHADCGIATRAVAISAGLDFIPLTWERFDLVLRQRDYFLPPLQALFEFLRSKTFVDRAKELGGYDIGDAGRVRWLN